MRSALTRLLPQSTATQLRTWRNAHFHTLYRGRDREGTTPAFVIFGDDEWANHLARVYLHSPDCVTSERRFNWAECADVALRLAQQHGLVLFGSREIPPLLESRALRVRQYVALTVDICESDEALYARIPHSARSDARRAALFRGQVCRDPEWSQEFFDRYHRDAIVSRHGSEGYVMQVPDMVRAVSQQGWEFLRIYERDQCVAAMLGQPGDSCYFMGRFGWLDANPELVRRGVLAATYWMTFQRARQLGLRKVRIGGTPPYIEDGVFQYKMKWCAELDVADPHWRLSRLLWEPSHPHVRAFLTQRSLVTQDAQERFVVYSGKRPTEVRMSESIRSGLAGWKRLAEPGEPNFGGFVDEPLTPTAKTPPPAPAT